MKVLKTNMPNGEVYQLPTNIEALYKVKKAISDLEGIEYPYDLIKKHLWPAQAHIDECIKELGK